jgi:DNA-binding NarL/FixJ family response regulator
MDIRMPGRDGLAATRDIVGDPRLAAVRVIMLTTFAEDEYVFEAIRAGASGFLVKDTEPAELLHAVRVVHRGDALLSPAVTRSLIAEFAARAKPPQADRALGDCCASSPSASARSSRSWRRGCPTTRSPSGSWSARPRPRPT